jgi:O-acetyl-ADP-ribose deacetylase (regulator of RNase III)
MPIEFRSDGNIFDSGAEALVNPVNCEGIMGAGLALEFKTRYSNSGMMAFYKQLCAEGKLTPGHIGSYQWLTAKGGAIEPKTPIIVFFPTKLKWANPSTLEWIEAGLIDLHRFIIKDGVGSLAMPALGCGKGGLKWPPVKDLIEAALHDLPCQIAVYEPR